ncbi:sortase [Yinghuangia seranimata]|uniref:sortase n=1 Tax=Yinghuangia seranimata TaxID=408067 RepID=UPI00248BB4BD|nr:class E sortase [Yinghuangia seranimata]MDI2125713.1 class E sortase [Yinghuangia seranimata]
MNPHPVHEPDHDAAALRHLLAASEGTAPRNLAAAARNRSTRIRARRRTAAVVSAAAAAVVAAGASVAVLPGGTGTASARPGASGTPTASGTSADASSTKPAPPMTSACPPSSVQPSQCLTYPDIQWIPVGGIALPQPGGTAPQFRDIFVTPSDEVLGKGNVGLYPGSANVGAGGNLVLTGRAEQPGDPFAALAALRAGDKVTVRTTTHIYTYTVDAGRDVKPGDREITAPVPLPPGAPQNGSGAYLTLIAAGPREGGPGRLVVWAHQTDVRDA